VVHLEHHNEKNIQVEKEKVNQHWAKQMNNPHFGTSDQLITPWDMIPTCRHFAYGETRQTNNPMFGNPVANLHL
jgi:hypothetical protein